MNEQDFQLEILNGDWTQARLARAEWVLSHLAKSHTARERLREYDAVRQSLRGEDHDIEPAGGWEAFEERCNQSIGRWRPVFAGRRTLALAATVLLAVSAGWFGRSLFASLSISTSGNMVASSQQWAPQDVLGQVRVFDEVASVFDQRAGWVAVSAGSSEVGLASHPIRSDAELMLIRLSILRDGMRASQTDLVMVPGQAASLRTPLPGNCVLHYQLRVSEEKPSTLDVQISLMDVSQGDEPTAMLTTTLPMNGHNVRSAGQLTTAAGTFSVNIGYVRAPRGGSSL
jgi:hypothetical protein